MRLRRKQGDHPDYPQVYVPDGDEMREIHVPADALPIVSHLLDRLITLSTRLDAVGGNVEGAYFDMDGVYDKLKTLQAGVADLNARLMVVEGDEYEDDGQVGQ